MEPFPLESHGARLKAFLIPPRDRPTVVFCHGFPGRNFNDGVARALAEHGYGALLFRYRGAHGSEGSYSFRGNEEDIRAAIRAVEPHAPHGLGVLGYSMGGFHAARVLAQDATPATFLVLQAPVAEVAALRARLGDEAWTAFLASGHDVLNASPADLVREALTLRPEEEPVRVAWRIRAPTLVLHGTKDEEVPPFQGRALHDAVRAPRAYVEYDTDHAFPGLARRIAEDIDRFVRTHVG